MQGLGSRHKLCTLCRQSNGQLVDRCAAMHHTRGFTIMVQRLLVGMQKLSRLVKQEHEDLQCTQGWSLLLHGNTYQAHQVKRSCCPLSQVEFLILKLGKRSIPMFGTLHVEFPLVLFYLSFTCQQTKCMGALLPLHGQKQQCTLEGQTAGQMCLPTATCMQSLQ